MEERGRQSIPAATQIYPSPSPLRPLTVPPAASSSFLPLVWKNYRRLGENRWPLFSPGLIERPSINLGRLAGLWMVQLEGNGPEGVGWVLGGSHG